MKKGIHWLDEAYLTIRKAKGFVTKEAWKGIIENSLRAKAPNFCSGCKGCNIRMESRALDDYQTAHIACITPCSRSDVHVLFRDADLEKVEITMAIPDPVTMAKIVESLKDHIRDGIINSPMFSTIIRSSWNTENMSSGSRRSSGFEWNHTTMNTERDLSRHNLTEVIYKDKIILGPQEVPNASLEDSRLQAELDQVEKWAEEEYLEDNATFS